MSSVTNLLQTALVCAITATTQDTNENYEIAIQAYVSILTFILL